MKVNFETALGSYRIQRFPLRAQQPLQAWDAADELLLNTLVAEYSECLKSTESRVLLVNDQFGALATALHAQRPDCWSDSTMSHAATEFNLHENVDSVDDSKYGFTAISSVSDLNGHYDLVLIKVPKTLALLEQQLTMVSGHITESTLVIAGGMTKHIHNSTVGLFETLVGPTRTSRATKKARLIFSEPKLNDADSPAPHLIESRYQCEPLHAELISYANGFSRERLDVGARAMLQALDKYPIPMGNNIADFGCGNGVLGLYALQKRLSQPAARVASASAAVSISFIDESYMAIAAAQKNFERLHGGLSVESEILQQDSSQQAANDEFDSVAEIDDGAKLEPEAEAEHVPAAEHSGDQYINVAFVAQEGIAAKKHKRYDWILCNPPFHIGNTTDTSVAKRMFQQSFQALQRNGQLWVVANRHLDYPDTIQSLFKNHQIIFSNTKFVVILAVKK